MLASYPGPPPPRDACRGRLDTQSRAPPAWCYSLDVASCERYFSVVSFETRACVVRGGRCVAGAECRPNCNGTVAYAFLSDGAPAVARLAQVLCRLPGGLADRARALAGSRGHAAVDGDAASTNCPAVVDAGPQPGGDHQRLASVLVEDGGGDVRARATLAARPRAQRLRAAVDPLQQRVVRADPGVLGRPHLLQGPRRRELRALAGAGRLRGDGRRLSARERHELDPAAPPPAWSAQGCAVGDALGSGRGARRRRRRGAATGVGGCR